MSEEQFGTGLPVAHSKTVKAFPGETYNWDEERQSWVKGAPHAVYLGREIDTKNRILRNTAERVARFAKEIENEVAFAKAERQRQEELTFSVDSCYPPPTGIRHPREKDPFFPLFPWVAAFFAQTTRHPRDSRGWRIRWVACDRSRHPRENDLQYPTIQFDSCKLLAGEPLSCVVLATCLGRAQWKY